MASAAFDFERMWKQIETAREARDMKEAEAARSCGFSRATWFNYRKDPSAPRLRDLLKIAEVFGFHFRAPLTKGKLSDPSRTVVSEPPTGGPVLKEHVARVAMWMQGLSEGQQEEVAKRVEEYLKIRGFHSPGAASEGPAAARRR